MKKFLLAGVCGALLIGCANPAQADMHKNLKIGLIATGAVLVCSVGAVCAHGVCEVADYFKASSELSAITEKHPEVIELLEKIDLMLYDCQNAADDLLLLHGAAEYTFLEAVTAIDRILPRLQQASRGFRNTTKFLVYPKYWFLKNWAREQFEKVEALIKNANEVATIIKSTPGFMLEVEKIERLRREREKLEIDRINANQPKNQVQVKNVV